MLQSAAFRRTTGSLFRASPLSVYQRSTRPISSPLRTMATTVNTPTSITTNTAAATVKKAVKEKPDQKYSSTLLLPKTEFPLRADPANREAAFRKRCTTDYYGWQVCMLLA